MMNRGFCGAVSWSVALAVLGGCGGSQSPIGAPGAMPLASASTPTRTIVHRPSARYRVLYRFDDGGHGSGHPGYDGVNPYGDLVAVNGVLYGTTEFGGGSCEGGCGTVYSMSTTGAHAVLFRFANRTAEGANPTSGLIDVNGTLYGTTFDSGFGSGGRGGGIYSISTTGTEKSLYAFPGGSHGANPWAGLVAVKGTLYGTTTAGGDSGSNCAFLYGCGIVYSISTSGDERALHAFASTRGEIPFADLANVNGKLYGTTHYGGSYSCNYGCGIVFSTTTRGKTQVLYTFSGGTDGSYPFARLIEVKGTLYGTTMYGGAYGKGTIFSITTTGTEKVLYSFAGGSDGARPRAGLTGVNGTLYGTTSEGGGTGCSGSGCGTVYSVTLAGAETVLHSFSGSPQDGATPYAGLTDVNGTLYGATAGGGHPRCSPYGTVGCGTVFALTP